MVRDELVNIVEHVEIKRRILPLVECGCYIIIYTNQSCCSLYPRLSKTSSGPVDLWQPKSDEFNLESRTSLPNSKNFAEGLPREREKRPLTFDHKNPKEVTLESGWTLVLNFKNSLQEFPGRLDDKKRNGQKKTNSYTKIDESTVTFFIRGDFRRRLPRDRQQNTKENSSASSNTLKKASALHRRGQIHPPASAHRGTRSRGLTTARSIAASSAPHVDASLLLISVSGSPEERWGAVHELAGRRRTSTPLFREPLRVRCLLPSFWTFSKSQPLAAAAASAFWFDVSLLSKAFWWESNFTKKPLRNIFCSTQTLMGVLMVFCIQLLACGSHFSIPFIHFGSYFL